jgi:putative thioredoxin
MPANSQAQAGLAQSELFQRISGREYEAAISAAQSGELTDVILAADFEVAYGNPAAGFERLILLIKQVSGEERTKVREHLLSLFQVIDPADPLLNKSRAALANALY